MESLQGELRPVTFVKGEITTMCGSKERQLGSHLSPVASFSILTRRHQRELRPRLKEQLRLCPSSDLKNLPKFQSWTSLLSVGNMNARSFPIRPACCIFSVRFLRTCRPHAPVPIPELWLWFGDKRPLHGQVHLPSTDPDRVSWQRWAPVLQRWRVRENSSAQEAGPAGPRTVTRSPSPSPTSSNRLRPRDRPPPRAARTRPPSGNAGRSPAARARGRPIRARQAPSGTPCPAERRRPQAAMPPPPFLGASSGRAAGGERDTGTRAGGGAGKRRGRGRGGASGLGAGAEREGGRGLPGRGRGGNQKGAGPGGAPQSPSLTTRVSGALVLGCSGGRALWDRRGKFGSVSV